MADLRPPASDFCFFCHAASVRGKSGSVKIKLGD
jgi:hypothetical protein